MNLRATNHPLKPDTALGVRDKDLTTPAIKPDGRASRVRRYCDCGSEATLHRCNAFVCQRCADIGSKAPPYVVGRRRYWGAPTQTVHAVTLGGWA